MHRLDFYLFFGRLHEQVLNVDLLPMLMIDNEFSLVEKEVFYLDEVHGGGGDALVLLPLREVLSWGPSEMARLL